MSETNPEAAEQGQAIEPLNPNGGGSGHGDSGDASASFSERYGEILASVNQALDSVDWNQMGRLGKATGVIIAVILAQVLIKGVLDTIDLIPVLPGLLELLGLIIVGQWSWKNLATSEKRNAVINQIQSLRKEYLG